MAISVYDVAVVGAGPAGLSAAASASRTGSSVVLLDAGPRPGGQYWRHPPGRPPRSRRHSRRFIGMATRLRSNAHYLPGHEVWSVAKEDDRFRVYAVYGEAEVAVTARTLVLATGAHDRQVPFPGWDLPGVYSAGAAQAMLKEHGVPVGGRVVVGGTGPFLLPVAAELAARGSTVPAVLEANRPLDWAAALPAVARSPGRIYEAARYAITLARCRVPYRTRHAIVAADGDGRVEQVTVARLHPDWTIIPGSSRTISCDAVAVGWGFTPRLELHLSLGCATRVDADGSLVAVADERQASDVAGVFVAGEACGVGGASLAEVEGSIAGRAAAVTARPSVDGSPHPRLARRRATLRRFAAAMHYVHPVRPGWLTWLRTGTLICRCEEVTLGAITETVHDLAASDLRSVKLLSRAGMGWCQGRICEYPAGVIVAAETSGTADRRALAERPLAVPVRLGLLARSAAGKEDVS